jgi:hypothetical protein
VVRSTLRQIGEVDLAAPATIVVGGVAALGLLPALDQLTADVCPGSVDQRP